VKLCFTDCVAFLCEDLAPYGVVLVPQSDHAFARLLAEILQRASQRAEGAAPVSESAFSRVSNHEDCAILVNRAEATIAHIAYIWSFRHQNGRITTSSRRPGTQPTLLLPFTMAGLPDRFRKVRTYWDTVFPGSKRLITADGECVGDNTDVSTPAEDERWVGGVCGVFAHPHRNREAEPVKLTIDGVFFVNGGFTGPNQLGSWDDLVAARDTHLECASQARNTGATPAAQADFFDRWQKLSGFTSDEPRRGPFLPLPRRPHARGDVHLEDIRRYQQESVARKVLMMRDSRGAAAALTAIAAWQDEPGPVPHKL
jgi:hypothetical protein